MKKTTIRLYQEIDLTISTIIVCHEKKCSLNWYYEQKDDRQYHGLAYVKNGSAMYYTQDNNFSVNKNEILYFPKESRYQTRGDAEIPYNYIVVNFQLSEDASSLLLFNPVIQINHYSYYNNMFHDLANTWFYKGIGYRVKCKAILQDILYHLLLHSAKNDIHTKNMSKIQSSLNYMETCYDREIKIDELADISHISVSHFRRIFKEIFGVSPLEYLNSIRINKAKDLLLSEMYTVSEVADKTGFNNIYYFSRAFKKATGVSPASYKIGQF